LRIFPSKTFWVPIGTDSGIGISQFAVFEEKGKGLAYRRVGAADGAALVSLWTAGLRLS